MKIILLKIFVLFFLISPNLLFSNNTDSTKTDIISLTFNPGFRSFQADFALLLFIGEMGVSLDYDLFKADTSKTSGFGFRITHEMYERGEPGGGHFGTPYYFTTLYIRATTASKSFRMDLYTGLSYLLKSETRERLFISRLGVEAKYMIASDIFGIFFKANAPIYPGEGFFGVGLYMGIGNTNL